MAMVRMPLPSPCSTAKAVVAEVPTHARQSTPSECASVARCAESSGCACLRRVNSTSRPATCAGPTSAAMPTATASVAPADCSNAGRCAAIAVLMNQVTAKTKAMRKAARRCCFGDSFAPACRLRALVVARGSVLAADGSSTWSGNPITRCRAAQAMQAPRQPTVLSRYADSGHPTVLANPANKVMPVIARRASWPWSRTPVAKAASYRPLPIATPMTAHARNTWNAWWHWLSASNPLQTAGCCQRGPDARPVGR